ncbi:signal recognition particle-docking protein FtsY [archaeon]|jgi:fused signal recognition particle receptor|nr:signal recognition particle-docking protein FtsY [archaeon]
MFKFLKKKLSGAVENISKKVEELPSDELVEDSSKELVNDSKKKKTIFTEIKKSISTKKITESEFDDLFWELELILLENSVAIEVIEKIKTNLKLDLVGISIERKKIKKIIEKNLNEVISSLFEDNDFDLIESIKGHNGPYIIVFVGVNGSGKTTSIAKVAKMLKSNGLSCVLSAADTFRAAAIEQLEIHGEKLGIDVIKHKYGADAAAVAFDSIQHAKSKKLDVVLIDTAGRLHSNINLMGELKKIIKISNPDLKIFVGESITGNDCVEQAVAFNENIELDGIILSKADIDEKGGAAISISYVTGKPILYFGTGQNYGDLEKFNMDKFFSNLGL